MLFRFKCQIGGRCREDRCYGSRGVTTGSAYFRSIAGWELLDADTFALEDPVSGTVTTFEFDKGYSLLMPNSAGMMIDDGAALTIEGVVFEFDKDNSTSPGATKP